MTKRNDLLKNKSNFFIAYYLLSFVLSLFFIAFTSCQSNNGNQSESTALNADSENLLNKIPKLKKIKVTDPCPTMDPLCSGYRNLEGDTTHTLRIELADKGAWASENPRIRVKLTRLDACDNCGAQSSDTLHNLQVSEDRMTITGEIKFVKGIRNPSSYVPIYRIDSFLERSIDSGPWSVWTIDTAQVYGNNSTEINE